MSKGSVLSILNPIADDPYAPEFFKPFGNSKSADKYNKKAFQIAAIVPIYTLLGMAIRNGMHDTSTELKKLDKTGPIATAMTSTAYPSSLASKGAADLMYQGLSTTVPLAASLAAVIAGMKIRDKMNEDAIKDRYDSEIASLEKKYNREIQKRLYPNGLPQKTAADPLEDLVGAIGIMKYLAPATLAIALTSGYATKKYFDDTSDQRKKARKVKKGLEASARTNWVPKMELPEDDIVGDVTV